MATYFTQSSCIFNVGSTENAVRAEEIRGELAADLYREGGGYPGFDMRVDHETGPGALHLYSEDCGDPDHVIHFVLRCAEELGLTGIWGFSWALTCHRPRLDGFGGGAHVIDLGARETIADLDCAAWVNDHIDAREGNARVEMTEVVQ